MAQALAGLNRELGGQSHDRADSGQSLRLRGSIQLLSTAKFFMATDTLSEVRQSRVRPCTASALGARAMTCGLADWAGCGRIAVRVFSPPVSDHVPGLSGWPRVAQARRTVPCHRPSPSAGMLTSG